jgi:hypothetical protein
MFKVSIYHIIQGQLSKCSDDGIKQSFTDNIPKEAMQHTNYDRKKMQKVMAGCLELQLAVKVTLVYLKLTKQ